MVQKTIQTKPPVPPRWIDYFLEWFLPEYLLEDVQGDLHEVYSKQVQQWGKTKASRAYLLSAIRYLRPYFFKSRRKKYNYNKPLYTDMIRNYAKIVLRSMARHKVFSFINISGLSVGLACCMLILLYNKDEVSYDRFHTNKDRLYRISVAITDENNEINKLASTNMIVGPSFKQEIPQIEAFVRMQGYMNLVRSGGETYNQEVLFADEDFFSVFSFPLLAGNPTNVLDDIHSVVLTEEAAKKYFGTTNVVGKTIEIGEEFEPFIITGVAKNPPQNSSIQFNMVASYNHTAQKYPDSEWLGFYINTFVLLHPQATLRDVEPKLDQVFLSKAKEEYTRAKENGFKNKVHFGLQPLLQIHLDTEYGDIRNGLYDGSKPVYAYILSGIAVFVLLIACINFIHLTTAHSLKRGKEIGIRKVVGGKRSQLIRQFLSESLIVCFIAFVLAIMLVLISLPLFNELANKRLSFVYLLDMKLLAAYIALLLLTGLAAGVYPALVLSGFNPVKTLYNRHVFTNKTYLTRGLVVVQFTLAIFLITTTLVVYAQFNFLTKKDLGYNDENLLTVHLGRREAGEQVALLKQELAKEPTIELIATKDPGQSYTIGEVNGKEIEFAFSRIDENYLTALQIPLAKGRNFSKDFPADAENSIIVNEAFVREAGWKEPIGKKVFNVNANKQNLTVVGVVKDYHFLSLREKIQPQLFRLGSGDLWVKIKPGHIAHSLQAIEKAYRQVVPFRPFEYEFMDLVNERLYEQEAKWKQMITAGTLLTLFISCIGLFGLTILSAQRRTKEIGIRKVFGASAAEIVSIFSLDFLKLILLAILLASPVAWYAANQWLQSFAYQITISPWMFLLAGALAIVVAFATMSFQALKAALANPVKSLRNE